MVDRLKDIDDYMYENINSSNECLEQPFFNVFLFRNNLYNNCLNEIISHNGYNIQNFNGTALHFAGGPGNFSTKYDKMLNFKKNIMI
jgi:hypothetical protein